MSKEIPLLALGSPPSPRLSRHATFSLHQGLSLQDAQDKLVKEATKCLVQDAKAQGRSLVSLLDEF